MYRSCCRGYPAWTASVTAAKSAVGFAMESHERNLPPASLPYPLFAQQRVQVYFGRPSDLPTYCQGLGKPPPAYSNVGEFFLEVVDEYEAKDDVKVPRMIYDVFLRRVRVCVVLASSCDASPPCPFVLTPSSALHCQLFHQILSLFYLCSSL